MANRNQNRVIVLSIVTGRLSVTEAAARFGVGRQWVMCSSPATESTARPGSNPARVDRDPHLPHDRREDRARILHLRDTLVNSGLDAGAESIHARLERERADPPSASTIWRILKAADTITPQPQKRPRSSIIRFEAPNPTRPGNPTSPTCASPTAPTWKSSPGSIPLPIPAARHRAPRITGKIVVSTFTAAADEHGLPASTLTDNGMVYTTRFARGGGRTTERSSTSSPGSGSPRRTAHPHIRKPRKIERFHQTLKQWIQRQPEATTIATLQRTADPFPTHLQPRNAPTEPLHRRTPAEAYQQLPKAEPRLRDGDEHWRVRYDTVDHSGTITIRYAGRLRHLGIGRRPPRHPRPPARQRRAHHHHTRHTGEILAEHTINPDRTTQPRNNETPSRRGFMSSMSQHLSCMSHTSHERRRRI